MVLDNKNEELLVAWVDNYYRKVSKSVKLKNTTFKFYKSLRGYFKHSIILTDIKQKEFGIIDYNIWERILTNVKSTSSPVLSGGLYFRYSNYKDICSIRSYYTTRKKFLDLELLIKTPFKDYYILNPLYVIKLYNPTDKKETVENED